MDGPTLPPDLVAAAHALAEAGIALSVGDAGREGFPLVFVNAAFERMTGYPSEEVLGRRCSFLQTPETDAAAVARIRSALADGRAATVTLENARRDGTTFYNELRLLAPRPSPEGGSLVVGVQNDVSRAAGEVARLRDVVALQERELVELRALQEALTPPSALQTAHLDAASAFVPAEQGVAGDFFLVTTGPAGSVCVAVGDVVGHGLGAAQRASFVRTSLATFAAFTDDPQRLLALANSSLIERAGVSDVFVTVACASFRPHGTMALALAGHPPPAWLDDGGPVVPRGGAGLPLGIDLDLDGAQAQVPVAPGRGVLFFTDGLPEARRAGRGADVRERFGDGRVGELLRSLEGATPQAAVAGMTRAVQEFVAGPLADDLCLVAVRARGG